MQRQTPKSLMDNQESLLMDLHDIQLEFPYSIKELSALLRIPEYTLRRFMLDNRAVALEVAYKIQAYINKQKKIINGTKD